MNDQPRRPVSAPTPLTQGFWDNAQAGRLVVQCCDSCSALRHYPQPLCPDCQSVHWHWQKLIGRGRVYTYTVCHRAFHPYWTDKTPYVLATIQLVEGPRMVSDLPTADTNRVSIGAPVEAFFEDVMTTDGVPARLPRFRLA